MKRFLISLAVATALCGQAALVVAAPWIHVEVRENGDEGAKVNVNVPLSLARMALDMAPDDVLSEGKIQIDDCDFSIADMRKLWAELREAGDGEFVTVEEDGELVKVFREGDIIYVQIDEDEGDRDGRRSRRNSGAKVRVQVPVALVDALLSGSGEEFDIDAALAELQHMGTGEIVRVEDGNDLVRVWID